MKLVSKSEAVSDSVFDTTESQQQLFTSQTIDVGSVPSTDVASFISDSNNFATTISVSVLRSPSYHEIPKIKFSNVGDGNLSELKNIIMEPTETSETEKLDHHHFEHFSTPSSLDSQICHTSNHMLENRQQSPSMPLNFIPQDIINSITPEQISFLCSWVEYYMSDDFIYQNNFILKHIIRNKNGFVSVKLLAAFKKLKVICGDYRVVALAISTSNKLVLNYDWTKLRRIAPIQRELIKDPLIQDLSPCIYDISCIVIWPIPELPENALECPEDCTPFGIVTSIMRPYYKDVVSITLRHPCMIEIPLKFQSYFERNPHAKLVVSAFVEFSNPELAYKVVSDWRPEDHVGTHAECIYLQESYSPRMRDSSGRVVSTGSSAPYIPFDYGSSPNSFLTDNVSDRRGIRKSCKRNHSFQGTKSRGTHASSEFPHYSGRQLFSSLSNLSNHSSDQDSCGFISVSSPVQHLNIPYEHNPSQNNLF